MNGYRSRNIVLKSQAADLADLARHAVVNWNDSCYHGVLPSRLRSRPPVDGEAIEGAGARRGSWRIEAT
ncbi:MAG: hypothetical protein ACC628_26345, partial [Pirellulaceae bacterium]